MAAVVLAGVLGGCGTVESGRSASGDGQVLTEADSGTEVLLAPGEHFEVRLESNASTGYRWKLLSPLEPAPYNLVTSDYIGTETSLVGAAGTEVWVFEAVNEPATGELRMVFVRPFDDPPAPAATFELTVRVEA